VFEFENNEKQFPVDIWNWGRPFATIGSKKGAVVEEGQKGPGKLRVMDCVESSVEKSVGGREMTSALLCTLPQEVQIRFGQVK
jgi:hypothetical protein